MSLRRLAYRGRRGVAKVTRAAVPRSKNDGICVSFDERPDSIGILLRGQSLIRVKDYWERFEEGYIVNTFKEEWARLSPEIDTKKWTHVVSRVPETWFTKKELEARGIGRVLSNHFPSNGIHPYHVLGVSWEYMPEEMHDLIPGIEDEGRGYPTVGLQTVAYVASIVRPYNVMLFGLDFYHSPYLASNKHRQPHHLDKQQVMVPFFFDLVRQFEGTTFHMATNYPDIPEIPNLVML